LATHPLETEIDSTAIEIEIGIVKEREAGVERGKCVLDLFVAIGPKAIAKWATSAISSILAQVELVRKALFRASIGRLEKVVVLEIAASFFTTVRVVHRQGRIYHPTTAVTVAANVHPNASVSTSARIVIEETIDMFLLHHNASSKI